MKKIWSLIKKHWQEDFSWPYYVSIIVFLAFSLLINYSIGLENKVIDRDVEKPIRMVWYFLLYAFAYYGACLLMIYFKKRKDLLSSTQFWLLSLIGMFLLAINGGFPYMGELLRVLDIEFKFYYWLYAIGNNAIGFFLTAVPLFLLYFLTKSSSKLYGLHPEGFETKPYFILLLILVPIITLASFDTSFQNYYPTYKTNLVAETLHWPAWLPTVIYEFVYGLDFFNTELLFRGFLVIGMAHVLGRDAIMPMVVTYCFLHFGKPAGEAISSIVGGYLLGVIAFSTRSIWGGVIVHVGLAWMMELAAYLQKVF